MRLSVILGILAVSLTATAGPAAMDPERSQGISMHMLPKRVADLGGQKWGFVVEYAQYLKPEPGQPVLQTVQEYNSFVQKQDASVRINGVWIVTTHPDAYSAPEKELLADVERSSKGGATPLFVVRGSELPNGWRRYDR